MKIKTFLMPLLAASLLPGVLSGEDKTPPAPESAPAQKSEFRGKMKRRPCRPCCHPRRADRRRQEEALENFLQRFPEADRARLKKLAQDDPAAFRRESRVYFRNNREKKRREWLELREQYLKSSDPAEKKALEEKLRADLTHCYDSRVKISEDGITAAEARLREMTDRLERLKKAVARRKENRDKWTERILRELLDPARKPFSSPRRLPPASEERPAGSSAGSSR